MVFTRSQKRSVNDDAEDSGLVSPKKLRFDDTESEFETETDTDVSDYSDSDWYDDNDDNDDDDNDDNDNYNNIINELKRNNPNIYRSFKPIEKELKRRNPNIIRIIKSNMNIQDKTNIIELCEIYYNANPFSSEALELKNKIGKLTEQYLMDFKEFDNSEKSNSLRKTLISNSTTNKYKIENKILGLETSLENKSAIYKKYNEMNNLDSDDSEYFKIKTWIDNATRLPFDATKKPDIKDFTEFLRNVSEQLDKRLYGMKKVKEEILVFLNSKLQQPNMKNCSLGLIGPPGTGKTTLIKTIAEVVGWPFAKISCGGISRPEYIKGHEYTYVGSKPGEISRCLMDMKFKNGFLFFDEFEKISPDAALSLFDIIDSSQNNEFRDHYFPELVQDLSGLWFFYSLNELPANHVLSDRIYILDVPGYSFLDKIEILPNYVLRGALKNINIQEDSVTIDKERSKYILNRIGEQEKTGIRNIERCINSLVNRIHFLVSHQDENGKIDLDNISFSIGKRLEYPITITNDIIDRLIKSRISDNIPNFYI